MVGQWPDGLRMHVANIAWALRLFDYHHIVVTTSAITRQYTGALQNVEFHVIDEVLSSGFIPFWDHFPNLWDTFQPTGAQCLFMEQDVLFARPLEKLSTKQDRLYSMLPESLDYHHLYVGDKKVHSRVWEGGFLIPSDLIQKALDNGVSFAQERPWINSNIKYYEKKLKGRIMFSGPKEPDTMDDLTAFCGLKAGTSVHYMKHQAVHLRGPEAVHRQFPKLITKFDSAGLQAIREINYDPWVVAAGYYISGSHDNFAYDAGEPDTQSLHDLWRLQKFAREWMDENEYYRLDKLNRYFNR